MAFIGMSKIFQSHHLSLSHSSHFSSMGTFCRLPVKQATGVADYTVQFSRVLALHEIGKGTGFIAPGLTLNETGRSEVSRAFMFYIYI